jgi:hypothetical protein
MLGNKRLIALFGAGGLALVGVLLLVWLPAGRPITLAASDLRQSTQWPRVDVAPNRASIRIVDRAPWANVLLYVDGALLVRGATWQANTIDGTWSWEWDLPADASGRARFFHSCDAGCEAWTQFDLTPVTTGQRITHQPTKLGVVFAAPDRDWKGYSAWNVELTYAAIDARDDYWHLDRVAERVLRGERAALKTLLRIDYDRGQAVPPADDYKALDRYLRVVAIIARDARFAGLHAIVIGSGVNEKGANSKAPEKLVTPAWYARIINGYGIDVSATDNVVDQVRMVDRELRVLVGPVRPWNSDQTGSRTWRVDQPWLNYMNTVVALLDESAAASALAGLPYASPDGFALQAPGRPDPAFLSGADAALEPKMDLRRAEWGDAHAGFRVYRDWMAIINAYDSTRGLPVYITAANTFAPGLSPSPDPPAKNYPRGWLRAAFEEVNREPQVRALCWFIDGIPGDDRWDLYSLQKRTGRLADAADDFDALLK